MSALHTGCLYPRKYSWYSFLLEAESPQGHSSAERIMSMKKFIDTIGNQTCNLPTCSPVPQPTAPPRAPFIIRNYQYFKSRVRYRTVNILYRLVAIQPRKNEIIHVSVGHPTPFLLSTGGHFVRAKWPGHLRLTPNFTYY